MLDTSLDVHVVVPGQCDSCGKEVPPGSPVNYCPACVKKVTPPKSKIDLKAAARQELAARELCRRRLLPFIQRIKPDYEAGWFHRDLAARLERFVRRVERGESPRLIINVPPRHGKTEQATRALPAWVLGKHPEWNFIAMTHTSQLAVDNSRDVQDYIKDERYQSVFPDTQLDPQNQGAAGWRTTAGGRFQPAGADKGISGRGGHIIIVDDPHRDRDAYSETVRATVWRTFKSSVKTRLAPGGGVILIQTRWVLDDLTGMVIEDEGLIEDGGKWEQVVYPAVALRDEYRLPSGIIVSHPAEGATLLRRKGEVLHPERYPLSDLEQHKKDPVVWAALYQQDPTAEGAGTFTEGMLEACACKMDDIPERLTYYATWDTAVSQAEGSCDSAEVVGGVDHDDVLWVTRVEADRLDGLQIADQMIGSHRTYNLDAVGVEKTNHSVAIAPFLDKYLDDEGVTDLNVMPLDHGNKDKVARARPMQARMRQGKVKIPTDAPWYEEFKKELLRFPSKPNDKADAFVYLGQLLDEMTAPREPTERKKKDSWRDKVRGASRSKSWMTA